MSLQGLTPFEITVRARSGAVVLDLGGEFDMSEVEAFRSCMDVVIASCSGAVVVDLADVTFIDSSAIQALLPARQCLADAGRQLRLQHLTVPAHRSSSSLGSPVSSATLPIPDPRPSRTEALARGLRSTGRPGSLRCRSMPAR